MQFEWTQMADGLAFPEGPIAFPDGSVVIVEVLAGRIVRIFPDGKKVTVAVPGGGPNGAAMGPDGKCYVCNNGGLTRSPTGQFVAPSDYQGGWIDRIDLESGKCERLYSNTSAQPISAPNDLVFDRAGNFWFTDTGKTLGRSSHDGAIYHASADGSRLREVIFPMLKPNGIGLSPDEKWLYVSETMTARLWRFEILGPGVVRKNPWPSVNGGELMVGLPGFNWFDSMAVDAAGNICVATIFDHGGISVVGRDGTPLEHVPTNDPMTTNICFGGADMETAYITLSGSGRLVTGKWPRPGLVLNFQIR